MADEKTVKKQDDTTKPENNLKTDTTQTRTGGQLFFWVILAAAVVVCAGAGLGLSRLFAGSTNGTKTKQAGAVQEKKNREEKKAGENGLHKEATKAWYYDLDAVIANLNEPGATRYVRAVVTLEIAPGLAQEEGKTILDEKKPLLTNWLNIFFAGLSVEDLRGDKNQKLVQSQITDAFNEKLFPDAKPQIRGVLFKEFAIQ